MERRKYIWTVILFATAAKMAWAQVDAGQTPNGQVQASAPAPGSNVVQAKTVESPAGGDQAQPEPPPARHSFFLAGLHLSESAEIDPNGDSQNSAQLSSTTRVLGSLHWLSIKRRSETAVDYLGGGDFSNNPGILGSNKNQLQQLNAEQRLLWHRGELTFKDEFGDLPGGTFGSVWSGGAGAYNLGFGGLSANQLAPSNVSDFFGSSSFGGLGQGPRITNISLVEVRESLTPRSSITLASGYGFTSYSRSDLGLINSRQIAAQVSFSYQVSQRDQIGVVYGFRSLRFPRIDSGTIETNLAELVYERQISRRMNLEVGVGPEFVKLSGLANGNTNRTSVSGNASLGYRMRSATLTFSYDRLATGGSGLFAGANTDTAQVSLTRPVRHWAVSFDAGFARLSQLGQASSGTTLRSYRYGFAGAAIQRSLGRHADMFASYQFSDQSFGDCDAAASSSCSRIGQGHTLLLGIDFLSRPKRLE